MDPCKLIRVRYQSSFCCKVECLIKILLIKFILFNIVFCQINPIYGADRSSYKYTLDHFNSVEDFEKNYTEYIQNCLATSGGGMGSLNCLIESQVWDKELNIQYKKLYLRLSDSDKKILIKAQQKWILMRDENVKMEEELINNNDDGTMNVLIRANMIDKLTAEMIKQRVLYLIHLMNMLPRK